MNTARLLRAARLEAGLSQRELADRVGTRQSAIARWESGRVSPRVDTLERLLGECGFETRLELERSDPQERRQLLERLRWSPRERLRYLEDMVAFQERARRARRRLPA